MASTLRDPSLGLGSETIPEARRHARFSDTRMLKKVEASLREEIGQLLESHTAAIDRVDSLQRQHAKLEQGLEEEISRCKVFENRAKAQEKKVKEAVEKAEAAKLEAGQAAENFKSQSAREAALLVQITAIKANHGRQLLTVTGVVVAVMVMLFATVGKKLTC